MARCRGIWRSARARWPPPTAVAIGAQVNALERAGSEGLGFSMILVFRPIGLQFEKHQLRHLKHNL